LLLLSRDHLLEILPDALVITAIVSPAYIRPISMDETTMRLWIIMSAISILLPANPIGSSEIPLGNAFVQVLLC
jgi:hypothetical protein